MLDFSEYRGREIIVCCQTAEQVDALCECIVLDKPSLKNVDAFRYMAKKEPGGVGLRLYITVGGNVAWRGYSNAGFYKRDSDYRDTPILEFDEIGYPDEMFQAPEIPF